MTKLNGMIGLGMGLVAAAAGATSAFASVADLAGTWEGTGAAFSIDGKELSTYTLEIVTKAVGDHEVKSDVTVSLADGTQMKFSQTMKDSGSNSFSLSSDTTHGGGYCLGEGLCAAYIDAGNGHAYAINIVMDSETQDRLIRTELQDGKGVRIYREKHFKIN